MKGKYAVLALLFVVVVVLVGGCASTRKVRNLEQANEQMEAQNERVRAELEESARRIAEQDRQIAGLRLEAEQQRAAHERELALVKATHESLVADLQKEIASGDIQVRMMQDRLQLTVAERLFFESGMADIKPQGRQVLRRIGGNLKKIPQKNIRIEGHTDNVPIGPRLKARYPTNWELGAVRAVNVARFLQGEAGIDPLRLSAVSYGQYRPVASNKTEAGRARNRRIEIILIDRDLDLAKKMRQYL
jgi:chemotaxis protein MotB